MLESFVIVVYKLVVIVRVNEIAILSSKNIAAADIDLRQQRIVRIFDQKHFFCIKIKVSSLLIPQIGVCASITDYFNRFFNSYGAVVGSDDYLNFFLRNFLQ